MSINVTLLKEICEVAGAPGFEGRVRELVLREIRPLCDEISIDKMGNVTALKRGRDRKKVMIAAHMDEIGFIVTHIDDNGFLRFHTLGGFDPKTLVAQRVPRSTPLAPTSPKERRPIRRLRRTVVVRWGLAYRCPMTETIYREPLDQQLRHQVPSEIFGSFFPLRVEPFIFNVASQLSDGYTGGYWEFYTLSNGAFYIAPVSERHFRVTCPNGYEGTLSPDAFGITCCLYAYSNLSFEENERLARECARHFHTLRDYMLEHEEAGAILRAISFTVHANTWE